MKTKTRNRWPKNQKGNLSSYSEEGEAHVDFVSIGEEHYHQIFISAEILHWNSSVNRNTAFKCDEAFGHKL